MNIQPLQVKDWLENNPEEAMSLIKEFMAKSNQQQTKTETFINSSLSKEEKQIPFEKPIDNNDPLVIVSVYTESEGSLYDRIAQLALFFTKAERCAIFFINEKDQTIYSTAYDFLLKINGSYNNSNSPSSSQVIMGSGNSLTTSSITRVSRTQVLKINLKSSFFQKVIESNNSGAIYVEDLTKEKELKGILDAHTNYDSKNLMALPIFNSGNNHHVVGVACFINKLAKNIPVPFTASDELTFTELLHVLGLSLSSSILYESLKNKEKFATDLAKHNEKLYQKAIMEARKNKMMLELASAMFGEDDVRELGRKIVSYARELINADKASVFLLNEDTKELVSAVFDTNTQSQFKFPATKGIAGHVVTKGELLNLKNAYDDSRFNPELDIQTGYKTQSILSIPIPGPNKRIVGVANLINKIDNSGLVTDFTKDDEESFQTFSMLCGLSLHKTLLLDEIKKKQLQLEINMDLMSYHAVSHTQDLHVFLKGFPEKVPIKDLMDFDYDCHQFESTDDLLCVISYQMFEELGFLNEFKLSTEMCMQYILTIRKNYRHVAYHNFCHAVSVTHSVFLLFKNTDILSKLSKMEGFSMFLAALNHDIDHRGTNNQFQKSAHTALANYYSTSTMERHHFNHAVNILRSPGHNMFHSLSSEDYKKCLKSLEKAILATDLALYFANKGKLKSLVETNTFNFNDPLHSDLAKGIVMTCSDLTAMTKPWKSSRRTADAVYSEFFFQGDEEKRLGLPISANLMDRNNVHEIPSMQVGFFNAIVTPAFELLASVFPSTHRLLGSVKANYEKWKELLESKVKYEIQEH